MKTVLVANPAWWDKPRHNLTEINFTPIKSDATRTASLLSGVLDATISVPLQDVQRINSSGTFTVVQGPDLRTIFFGMDQFHDELLYSDIKGKNPFKDIRVRKALYQAIDVEAIKRSVMRGLSWPAGMIVSPALNGAPQGLNTRLLPFNPDASKSCWPKPVIRTDSRSACSVRTTVTCMTNRSAWPSFPCSDAWASRLRRSLSRRPSGMSVLTPRTSRCT
ncbi:ABC transporter substrate-binding protein [Polaromonas sp. P1(28)-13]|nr:ABC transporter substrate-binding protein [Polaromonas sp. P1(28)-13]